jgi:hypothetical protein
MGLFPPQPPRAHGLNVSRGQPVDFMVDTGAEHSVVTQRVAPIYKRPQTIVRATGIQAHHPFLQP